jgi:hypothetical protein
VHAAQRCMRNRLISESAIRNTSNNRVLPIRVSRLSLTVSMTHRPKQHETAKATFRMTAAGGRLVYVRISLTSWWKEIANVSTVTRYRLQDSSWQTAMAGWSGRCLSPCRLLPTAPLEHVAQAHTYLMHLCFRPLYLTALLSGRDLSNGRIPFRVLLAQGYIK